MIFKLIINTLIIMENLLVGQHSDMINTVSSRQEGPTQLTGNVPRTFTNVL